MCKRCWAGGAEAGPRLLGHPKLPKALVEELALQNPTYEEAIKGCEGIPSHRTLLKLLRGWRSLTPQQKAAWDQRAREYNLSGADPAATN